MCDNADVSKNRFNYHGIGLGLGAPQLPTTTSIGPQSKKENRWFGTNSPIEAYALNPATAMDSKFEINSSDLNSDYWPLPRKIGSTNDNFVWFTQLIGYSLAERQLFVSAQLSCFDVGSQMAVR
jgi:hypothetical protein